MLFRSKDGTSDDQDTDDDNDGKPDQQDDDDDNDNVPDDRDTDDDNDSVDDDTDTDDDNDNLPDDQDTDDDNDTIPDEDEDDIPPPTPVPTPVADNGTIIDEDDFTPTPAVDNDTISADDNGTIPIPSRPGGDTPASFTVTNCKFSHPSPYDVGFVCDIVQSDPPGFSGQLACRGHATYNACTSTDPRTNFQCGMLDYPLVKKIYCRFLGQN